MVVKIMYSVYDFTTKRYLKKQGDDIAWTCFKRDAHLCETQEEAQTFIDFWRPFTANEFRILTVHKQTGPLKASAGFAHDNNIV